MAVRGECAADMVSETNRELESQRLELYQANQWADQVKKKR